MAITPVKVSMTWNQVGMAAHVGVTKQIMDIQQNRRQRYGASDNDRWVRHIDGAIAECALSIYQNIPWDGAIGDYGQTTDDVGPYQCRSTQWPHGHLLLHPSDNSQKQYVLATMHNLPNVWLVGWCFGFEGKLREYWDELRKGRPCYVVPRQVLRDMTTLTSTARTDVIYQSVATSPKGPTGEDHG